VELEVEKTGPPVKLRLKSTALPNNENAKESVSGYLKNWDVVTERIGFGRSKASVCYDDNQ
jgi:hypothetical protein